MSKKHVNLLNELKEHKHPEIIGKKDVYNLD
ncbi:unnamed protein product, partial [marine sediment metagenome]